MTAYSIEKVTFDRGDYVRWFVTRDGAVLGSFGSLLAAENFCTRGADCPDEVDEAS